MTVFLSFLRVCGERRNYMTLGIPEDDSLPTFREWLPPRVHPMFVPVRFPPPGFIALIVVLGSSRLQDAPPGGLAEPWQPRGKTQPARAHKPQLQPRLGYLYPAQEWE